MHTPAAHAVLEITFDKWNKYAILKNDMTKNKYNSLKVGDKVKLIRPLADYSCGHKTIDGKVYVPSGTKGVVGAIKVPSVWRDNVTFCCVDFNFRPAFVDYVGKPANHWQRKDLSQQFRVAAKANDIEAL